VHITESDLLSQEDPFKLVVLGRDVQHVCVSNADFFFGRDGQLFFLVSDDEGVLRIYEFNPTREEGRFTPYFGSS
jgi:cleavage and polyadenylation specificity factor subunit 1